MKTLAFVLSSLLIVGGMGFAAAPRMLAMRAANVIRWKMSPNIEPEVDHPVAIICIPLLTDDGCDISWIRVSESDRICAHAMQLLYGNGIPPATENFMGGCYVFVPRQYFDAAKEILLKDRQHYLWPADAVIHSRACKETPICPAVP